MLRRDLATLWHALVQERGRRSGLLWLLRCGSLTGDWARLRHEVFEAGWAVWDDDSGAPKRRGLLHHVSASPGGLSRPPEELDLVEAIEVHIRCSSTTHSRIPSATLVVAVQAYGVPVVGGA